MKRWHTASVLALALIYSGTSVGQAQKPATATAEKPAADRKTHTVTKGPFKVEAKLTGVFEPAEMADVVLRPETWSTFQVLKAVEQGTRVKAGQPLVWFDTKQIDEQIQDLKYSLELSALSMKQAEHGLYLLEKTVPMDLELAERSMKQADDDLKYFLEVDRPYSEKSAEYSRQSSEYYLEYAQEELDQLEKMYKADDLTEETEEIILKRARRSVESAQFQVEGTRLRTERLLNVTIPRQEEQMIDGVQRQQLQLDRTRTTLPMQLSEKRIELEKQRFEQQKSQQKMEKLQKDRESFVLKSPADGIVYYGRFDRGKWSGSSTAEQQLRRGGTVSPHQIIMTIVSPQVRTVRVEVAEKDYANVRPGVTGHVVATAFPDERVPASVAEVSAIPVDSGKFDGKIELGGDGRRPGIVPGMACEVKLVAYQKDDAITVPASAVFEDELDATQQYVYLATDDGGHEKRPVTVGRKTDKEVEILKGLKPGDEILEKKPDEEK